MVSYSCRSGKANDPSDRRINGQEVAIPSGLGPRSRDVGNRTANPCL